MPRLPRLGDDLGFDPRQLGLLVENARLRRGWSRYELQRRACLRSQDAIRRLERGESPLVALAVVARVAAALEVSLDMLVGLRQ